MIHSEKSSNPNPSTTGHPTQPTLFDTSHGDSETTNDGTLGSGLKRLTKLHTLSLIDECELKHRSAGYDYGNYIDGYINGFVGVPDTYFIKGPDVLIMAHHAHKDPNTGLPREYWHIHYLATRKGKNKLDVLFQWMPYHLPEIGTARPFKNNLGLRFFKTDRLLRLCRHFHDSSTSSADSTSSTTWEEEEKPRT